MGKIQKEMVPIRTSYILPIPPYTDGWCSRRKIPVQFARRDKSTIQINPNFDAGCCTTGLNLDESLGNQTYLG